MGWGLGQGKSRETICPLFRVRTEYLLSVVKENMKTKDGHEITLKRTYHLENGQEVIVNSCAVTSDGKHAFMVVPLYEGEAMQVSGDGGYHHEYTMDYEHEGMEMLVRSIFVEPPVEKLQEKYKASLSEIESLSLSVGLLISSKTNLSQDVFKLGKAKEAAAKEFLEAESKKQNMNAKVDALDSAISESRQKLSELEDSIGDLKPEDVSSLVSKKELQRLNKRDFKMDCLEAGGIDNWEWYDESLKDYRERYPE